MSSSGKQLFKSYCFAIALSCGLSLFSNLALAQEEAKMTPITGVISIDSIVKGAIAYKTGEGYTITPLKQLPPSSTVSTDKAIANTYIEKYRGSGKVKYTWVSSDFLVITGDDELKLAYNKVFAFSLITQRGTVLTERPVVNFISFTENSAFAYKDGKYYMIEAKDGELTVRDTDYTYKVPSAKEAYYDKFKLCESFGKMFDFKLSSKSKVICADNVADTITQRYLYEEGDLIGISRFKHNTAWSVFQKNYFIDAVNSPNGGYYLKDGILYAPLYREGREVWEPLTDKPTEAFTPISGMKVKGGAILKDAIYSDRGVCGRDGYSQAFWLKTSKGEQLLHINTPESFWVLESVSPDGCKVALFDYANNWPDCFGNSGSLKVLDVCGLQ